MASLPGTPIFARYVDNGFIFEAGHHGKINKREISIIDLENFEALPNRDFNLQTKEAYGKQKYIQMLKCFHSSQIQIIESSEFNDKEVIKYLLATVELLGLINSEELNYDRLDTILQGVKKMLGEFSVGLQDSDSKDGNFDRYFIITDHFMKTMAADIGKIIKRQVVPKDNFEEAWGYFTRILEKTYEENKSIKETLKNFKEKMEELKKNIKSLFEVIELTDMPQSPEKL